VRAKLELWLELKSHNRRLLPMEGLRGLAVLLVFVHHYLTQALLLAPPGAQTPISAALKSYGNVGVELFFVLSGYLIYGMVIGKKTPFLTFMRRRAERIYPTFLVMFALSLALQWSKVPAEGTLVYLVANALLLPGLFPIPAQVTVAWSLSFEIFFYFVTPLFVAALRLRQQSAAVRTGTIFVAALLFIVASALFEGWPYRMLGFLMGMLLVEGVGRRVPAWLGLAAPPVAFLIGALSDLRGIGMEAVHVASLGALTAVCLHEQPGAAQIFSWTPLRWLGNMSYSYYLMHGYVTSVVALVLTKTLGQLSIELSWALMPLVFVLSVLPSLALFVLVEKPLSLRPTGRAAAQTIPSR